MAFDLKQDARRGSGDQVLTLETYFTDELDVDDSGIRWAQVYKVWKIKK